MLAHAIEHGGFDEAGQWRNLVRVHRRVRCGRDQFTCEPFRRQASPKRVHEAGLVGPNRPLEVGPDVVEDTVKACSDQGQIQIGGLSEAGRRSIVTNPPVLWGLKVSQNFAEHRLEEALPFILHAPPGPSEALEARPSPVWLEQGGRNRNAGCMMNHSI